ncbi:MAG: tRNA preQ1(34) S-adenosylmethionine ribosyltransferase-isomerase QueA [Francisellaceae bacterium]|jgi:S-adenosylmethionine:tRNA ribosyltransferase-isomerase|nr:tRNA preQ1(34) S-adenosylmethionine ribosyltransferase-isomerase QueA [Francisellaceae bacterium]MBT6539209.1 tRNA preQ1(34) S-adenosylmethionine ribosyltransferase-isomerase QueA [Francisellaceae bacterium]
MLTELFDYQLPETLIAKYPLKERSDSRMLVCSRDGGDFLHSKTKNLSSFLQSGDLLVANDTKVLKARMFGYKSTGGKVEILLERLLSEQNFLAYIRASHAPKPGAIIEVGECQIEIIGKNDNLFECKSNIRAIELMDKYGNMPIPPYFARDSQKLDDSRYQTTYADQDGSVAAPTAGLHIDGVIKSSLAECDIMWKTLTLHIGAGTFQTVKVVDTCDHVMHYEHFEIDKDLCEAIAVTKANGGRIIAVGTTTVRALESAYSSKTRKVMPYKGLTNLFITPGRGFNVVDGMLTNFHLPKSSLLMLVGAFTGIDRMQAAYTSAIKEKYRFYSYGDAMLIL